MTKDLGMLVTSIRCYQLLPLDCSQMKHCCPFQGSWQSPDWPPLSIGLTRAAVFLRRPSVKPTQAKKDN